MGVFHSRHARKGARLIVRDISPSRFEVRSVKGKFLGDDGRSSWDLPSDHIWCVAVMQDGHAGAAIAVFTEVEKAWQYADQFNLFVWEQQDLEVWDQVDGTAVVDFMPLNPPYES